MTNPFEILKIADSANDAEIRAAYLARVREFPPERAPQEFQAIREAYEQIKTEKARLAYRYLDHPEIDAEAVCRMLLADKKPGRPDERQFREMLRDTLQSAARDTLSDP